MGYKYQNHCFDTVGQLYDHMAAQCPPVSGNSSIVCAPQALPDQIQITATDLQTSLQTISYIQPPLLNCDLIGADFIELNWLFAGLIVAASGARFIADALRGKS
jgi:hypothetical protein